MHPFQLQRRDHREADRPAADHQRHLVAAHVGFLDGVDADRERLGQRGMLGASPFGTSSSSASLSNMRSA